MELTELKQTKNINPKSINKSIHHKALQQATDHKEKDKTSSNFNFRLLQRWII